jgi:hypothetical protein
VLQFRTTTSAWKLWKKRTTPPQTDSVSPFLECPRGCQYRLPACPLLGHLNGLDTIATAEVDDDFP